VLAARISIVTPFDEQRRRSGKTEAIGLWLRGRARRARRRQAKPSQAKPVPMRLLGSAWFYSSESGLSKALWRKNKKDSCLLLFAKGVPHCAGPIPK
jgi:hypothetical protein